MRLSKYTGRCTLCNRIKKSDEFWSRPWGHNSWCKDCCRLQTRIKDIPKTWWGQRRRDEFTDREYKKRLLRIQINKVLRHEKMRACAACQEVKTYQEYHKGQYTCKKCRLL